MHDPKFVVSAALEDNKPQVVVVVTRFDRFQAESLDANEAGITVKKLTSDSTHTEGTILFLPWHQVDHIVISTPEGAMDSDDHTFPKGDDTSTIMTRSGAV